MGYQIVTKISLASYSNGLFLAMQSPQWSSRPSGHLSSRCWHMILGCFKCVWLLLYQHLLLWPLWWSAAGWKEGLESWEVEIHEPMTNFKCEEVILLSVWSGGDGDYWTVVMATIGSDQLSLGVLCITPLRKTKGVLWICNSQNPQNLSRLPTQHGLRTFKCIVCKENFFWSMK